MDSSDKRSRNLQCEVFEVNWLDPVENMMLDLMGPWSDPTGMLVIRVSQSVIPPVVHVVRLVVFVGPLNTSSLAVRTGTQHSKHWYEAWFGEQNSKACFFSCKKPLQSTLSL